MLQILYFAQDLADPAVRRRILMLKAGGARVTLAGFRRGANALAAIEGIDPIELGTTRDGRFAQRVSAITKACLSLPAKLRAVGRPDLIIARNLDMLAVANKAFPCSAVMSLLSMNASTFTACFCARTWLDAPCAPAKPISDAMRGF